MKYFELWPELQAISTQFEHLINREIEGEVIYQSEDKFLTYVLELTDVEVEATEDSDDLYKDGVSIQRTTDDDDLAHGALVTLNGDISEVCIGMETLSLTEYIQRSQDGGTAYV
ncbi:hypothetical protein AB4455_19475 [Vibrio sp. 10N.261.46.E12]|uniref:hypothetical protein n=1 Tax=unclassified Vibrio TaxID=2614977 RepID=UPI000977E15F|nr:MULTISPECIES: hypothetical protein [unclassified Vibrio]OMO33832.1 hypothetical protein BH584_00570 [Vibrio sp. 10N.261.45.E1]PMJ19330.1 hypothetical protein BCU27_21635 [Vibrio sp. 10N.286.45.B6]PML97979.1 hypothetical protein BCT66_20645 [Vibrio sp. 10N.261.49.E11]PMM83133.1 hypothetical protein BCT46_02340 [Vibrio sp. 10N.261.46.E8]PMN59085.1 hypothetical protein BCT32_22340 [Vibrio sp. 10N.261.45.E11]